MGYQHKFSKFPRFLCCKFRAGKYFLLLLDNKIIGAKLLVLLGTTTLTLEPCFTNSEKLYGCTLQQQLKEPLGVT